MENKQTSDSAASLSSFPGRSDLVEVTNRPRTNEAAEPVADGKGKLPGTFRRLFCGSGYLSGNK